jgi:hypothetical protein
MITDKPGIVIARPPRRTRRTEPPQPAISGPLIVKRERRAKPAIELPDDPEADAQVAAFFARMIKPAGKS